jgi:NAD(P)-dependent dehydrogenase (short-subunit alcohol dehydrogenase family)
MTSAVVIGASGGIGAALADAIEEEAAFDRVWRFGRSMNGGAHLNLTDEASIAAAAALVAAGPAPALVLVATGLLHGDGVAPEKSMRELDGAAMAELFAINATGPALVAKHFLPLLPKAGRCVFAVLSARVGSIADNKLGGWYGYRASKAALNQLVRTLSIEEKRRNDRSIVVALHPGTVDTALSRPFQAGVRADQLFAPDRAAVQLLDVIDGLKAPDSGKHFGWDGAEIAP